MKALAACGHQVTVISIDCLKVSAHGIFAHSSTSLHTQFLRSNCVVSRRLRKLNSAQVGVECYMNSMRIETLSDLSSSYVPEDSVLVGGECGELLCSQMKYKLNKLQAQWPQHDRPIVCVIAQQYSSTRFVPLRLHSTKKLAYEYRN
jgi:hypothetical protein